MPKVGIIIQARMGASRLPGKVLKDLGGKPVLWHMVERCKHSKLANAVIVATSTEKADDAINQFCQSNNIEVYRGSQLDVLNRFASCAKEYELDVVVRITADCPLIDPAVIDGCIKMFLEGNADYVSNVLNRNFPRGLDCEIFSAEALSSANENANLPAEREHVTLYIIKNGKTLTYEMPENLLGDFRLTLDEEKDYEMLSLIYNKFYEQNKIINAAEVITFLKQHPEIATINSTIKQKLH